MKNTIRQWVVLLCILASPVFAQESRQPWDEYGKKIKESQAIGALGPTLFGDQVDFASGALSFSATDVAIPGNNTLPVQLRRKFAVTNRKGYTTNEFPMADWDLDLPHISAVLATSGASNDLKCVATTLAQARPPFKTVSGGTFAADEFWNGNYLNMPGGGGGELMLPNPAAPKPTSGGPYYWVTSDYTYLGCLSSVQNGTGEGFFAITADGTKYWFDWVGNYAEPSIDQVTAQSSAQSVTGKWQATATLFRTRRVLYATRVEDRFGNWVTYSYASGTGGPIRLTSIQSSDGRQLLAYYDNPSHGFITRIKDGADALARTWSYEYTQQSSKWSLTGVVLPDTSRWTIDFAPLSSAVIRYEREEGGDPVRDCDDPGSVITPGAVGTITHPSGAIGEFAVQPTRHGRSNVPMVCSGYTTYNNPNDDVAYYALNYDAFSLITKKVTGPGLALQQWSYGYSAQTYFAPGTGPVCTSGDCMAPICTADACAGKAFTVVIGPGNQWSRYTFGNSYRYNEGKLLRVETGTGPTNILRTEETTYELGQSGLAYPTPLGTSPQFRGSGFASEYLRPQKSVVTTQDGASFSLFVNAFDAYAKPLSVTRSSTLGFSKTEETVYAHNLGKWVIGQAATRTLIRMPTLPNILVSQTDYDANAMPWKTYSFGKLQQTLTYETTPGTAQTGTLASVQDGNHNITVLGNWKRGIPQLITFPATTDQPIPVTQSAVVNDRGEIASVTDENGYLTSYGYDAMGRMASIAHPTGDTVAWNATTQTFAKSTVAAYGLPIGHWQQTISTGNARKIVYFDAFWRPVVTESFDNANAAATRSVSVTRYGLNGKPAYQSYALDTLGSFLTPTTGTRTFYDALDRVTTVEQDSELGVLSTTTAYLVPFKTETTNPRGKVTRMSYMAFDQPTYEMPNGILEYEGRGTSIYRDAFGKPTSMRRYWGSEESWRYYVYDVNQQLCKTIEPETGASLTHYDGAGNIDWTATGLSLPSTTDCDASHASVAARKVTRTYDARNRVKTLTFPDGQGNQTWTYTPDGLVASMTAYNAAGNTAPVVTAYNYNKRRLIDGQGEVLTQPGWYDWGIGYGYDANGSLASQIWPTGMGVTYLPNALGQPTRVLGNDSQSYASSVSYFPNGAIKQFTYGNGLVHTMTQNTRQLPARSIDGGSALDHQYGYDPNGNVTQILDYAQGTNYNRTLTYDGLDRLSTASSPHFGGDGVHRFAYNALDDLASWTLNGVKDHATYEYDANKRLTNIRNTAGASIVGLGYDVQGNLANKNGQTYSFDYGNRLRAAYPAAGTVEAYRYDGHGRRVLAWHNVQGNLHSQYSQSGQLMFEADERKGKHREHIHLGGSLIATRETPSGGSATVKYQHTDALGSPVAVTNASGAVVDRTAYEPYGAAIGKPSYQGVGYTGHVMDGNTGLAYMQQRYYDPQIGRMLSVDPVTAYGSGDMRHFNVYAYAYNNPYKFTDPDGRCPEGSTTRTCIQSSNEAKAGSMELSAQTQSTYRSQGSQVQVQSGASDEKVGAIVNSSETGSEKVVVMDSSTSTQGGVDTATTNGVPENMVAVVHGHTGPSLKDSDKPGSMGDAQVLKDNGVPNIARDTNGRGAIHEVVDGRYQVRAAPGTRFTNDEINHFESRVDERQEYLNGN